MDLYKKVFMDGCVDKKLDRRETSILEDEKIKRAMFGFLTLIICLFFSFTVPCVYGSLPIKEIAGVYSLGKANVTVSEDDFSSQYVSGVSIRTGWTDIEPREGEFDWNYIDEAVKVAKKVNKKIMIRIIAGIATPEWVYQAGAKKFKYTDKNPYHRTYGQDKFIPIPWDKVYLNKWTQFVKAFGKRYNNEPVITIIHMTGPCRGGEMHLAAKKDKKRWEEAGFTTEKLVNAWKETIDAFSEAFPDKYLAIDIAKPVLFGESLKIVNDVIACGHQKLGKRFSVQGNWLAAKTRVDSDLYKLVKEYSSKTIVGFQMLWFTSAGKNQKLEKRTREEDAEIIERTRKRDRMGGTLSEAIEKGLAAGAIYLEIYRRDIINPELQEDIRYAVEKLKSNASDNYGT